MGVRFNSSCEESQFAREGAVLQGSRLIGCKERPVRMAVPKGESGQVLIMTVLAMTVLLGFMALAIDVGFLFRARRNMQIAADAAAIAAALDYKYNNSKTSAQNAGVSAAAANGVTSTGTCPIARSEEHTSELQSL